jgi:large subunit ribosomal protein L29
MKAGDIRELSMDELKEREKNLQEELFNLKFQHGTNQLENTMRLRHVKKDVARVKTIIREKELAAAAG